MRPPVAPRRPCGDPSAISDTGMQWCQFAATLAPTRFSPTSRASPSEHSTCRPRHLLREPRGQDTSCQALGRSGAARQWTWDPSRCMHRKWRLFTLMMKRARQVQVRMPCLRGCRLRPAARLALDHPLSAAVAWILCPPPGSSASPRVNAQATVPATGRTHSDLGPSECSVWGPTRRSRTPRLEEPPVALREVPSKLP